MNNIELSTIYLPMLDEVYKNEAKTSILDGDETTVQKGLNGENGVLIPYQNVKNLTLSNEIVDAVKNNQFHIYPISTIDEGIEILTGIPSGELNNEGEYPEGTINYLVAQKLKRYAQNSVKYSNN